VCVYIYIHISPYDIQYRTNYNTLNCVCTAALYDTHTHAQYTQIRHVCYRLLRFSQHFVFTSQVFLRRDSAATCLLELRVRIPLTACIFLSCECCVLSSSCPCDSPILHPGKSNLVLCVFLCHCSTDRTEQNCVYVSYF
jgi:hypothetical protein